MAPRDEPHSSTFHGRQVLYFSAAPFKFHFVTCHGLASHDRKTFLAPVLMRDLTHDAG